MTTGRHVLSRSDRAALAILAAIPLVMTAINDSWIYTAVGYLDPWYNVGYFLHYNNEQFLNEYYKISRLSWIIPGYVIYQIFNPLVANFILHAGVLFISAAALFIGLRRLFPIGPAFIAAAMLTVYSPFHGSGGWDYQTTPSGAYYLVAFALVCHAAFSPRRLWLLFLTGMSFGAAVHANVLFVNMLPILAAHYFVTVQARRTAPLTPASVAMACAVVLAGILAVTVLMGLINLLVGRDFIFFKVMLGIVTSYVADTGNVKQWWLPWSSLWFTNSAVFTYLTLPLVVCLASVAALLRAWLGRARCDIVALSLAAQFVAAALLWVIWQSVGHVALQPNYFAYPLIPVMFCAVGGLAALFWQPQDEPAVPAPVLLGIAALVAGPLIANVPGLAINHRPVLLFAVLAGTGLAMLALLAVRRPKSLALLAAAALFGVANWLTVASPPIYAYRESCKVSRKFYEGLITADRFLATYSRNSSNVHVWWDQPELLEGGDPDCKRPIYVFAASMTSFGLNYLAPPWSGMPAIADLPDASLKLPAGSIIAFPTNQEAHLDAMIARYKAAGVTLQLAGKTLIRARPASFTLYVLEVKRPA